VWGGGGGGIADLEDGQKGGTSLLRSVLLLLKGRRKRDGEREKADCDLTFLSFAVSLLRQLVYNLFLLSSTSPSSSGMAPYTSCVSHYD
jgi:hypothetical protein